MPSGGSMNQFNPSGMTLGNPLLAPKSPFMNASPTNPTESGGTFLPMGGLSTLLPEGSRLMDFAQLGSMMFPQLMSGGFQPPPLPQGALQRPTPSRKIENRLRTSPRSKRKRRRKRKKQEASRPSGLKRDWNPYDTLGLK